MIFHIAAQELRRLFLSPLAWCVMGVVQLIVAWFYLSALYDFMNMQSRAALMGEVPGVTEGVVNPLFGVAAFIILFAVPVITMRLISDERRSQTLSLLFSAPVSMSEIILGKYLGVTAFFILMVAMIVLMPVSLYVGGSLDVGMFLAGLLGFTLVVGCFTAVGLYMSTLTQHPAVAAVAAYGALLLLWVIGLGGDAGVVTKTLAYLSLPNHYERLLKGEFNSSDIVYYLLFIFTFLILSIRRLDADRLQH